MKNRDLENDIPKYKDLEQIAVKDLFVKYVPLTAE